jgi:hypothetical protein
MKTWYLEYSNNCWYQLIEISGKSVTRPSLALEEHYLKVFGLTNQEPRELERIQSESPPVKKESSSSGTSEATNSPTTSKKAPSEELTLWTPKKLLQLPKESPETAKEPLPAIEEETLSQAITHIIILEHSEHPEYPPNLPTHIQPHFSTITATVQLGQPVPT